MSKKPPSRKAVCVTPEDFQIFQSEREKYSKSLPYKVSAPQFFAVLIRTWRHQQP